MGQAWRFRGLQVTKSEHPWAQGKWSAQLGAFLRLLPLGEGRRTGLVLTGCCLALSAHMPLPLQEGRERRRRKRKAEKERRKKEEKGRYLKVTFYPL